MSSLPENYEGIKKDASHSEKNTPFIGTTTFINLKLQEEPPIFAKQSIKISLGVSVLSLVINNNHLIALTSRKTVLKINLLYSSRHDEIDVSKYLLHHKFDRIFMDYNGNHIIITLASIDKKNENEYLYLHWKSSKPKLGTRTKNYLITAVAWSPFNISEISSGPILFGTSNGILFETELICTDDRFFQSSFEQYFKQVHVLDKYQNSSITGILVFPIKKNYNFVILICTAQRLYQFVGKLKSQDEKPLLASIFENCSDISDRFLEIPTNLNFSQLQCYHTSIRETPLYVAWMNQSGIYFSEINENSDNEENITINSKLIDFPQSMQVTTSSSSTYPSFVLSEFHILLTFRNVVKGICSLNQQEVFSESFTDMTVLGITKDEITGIFWLYGNSVLHSYRIENETRNVWKIYMNQHQYSLAKEYCKHDNEALNMVLCREAEFEFLNKDFERSAQLFAQTDMPFEVVCLKFLELDEYRALQTYLINKLQSLNPKENLQRSILTLWILELYMNRMSHLTSEEISVEHSIRQELHSFLSNTSILECLSSHKGTAYNILLGYNDLEDMAFLASLLKDYYTLIQHYILQGEMSEALKIMTIQNKDSVICEFIPHFLHSIPMQTLDALITSSKKLQLKKLIPIFLQISDKKILNYGEKILKFIKLYTDMDYYNNPLFIYVIYLYAIIKPEELTSILKKKLNKYDLLYILRLCQKLNLEKICIYIYSELGLYEQAVELALRFDLDVAKDIAKNVNDNMDLNKRLWLQIAKYILCKEQKQEKIADVLVECPHIKLEDILPFFPDFVTIDYFKDAICAALEEYNQQIFKLKEEMEEATVSTECIKKDISLLKNRYAVLKANEKCTLCNHFLLSREVYIFPCNHKFHADCLVNECSKYPNDPVCAKAVSLYKSILTSKSSNIENTACFTNDLDAILSSECIFCGPILIRLLEEPFVEMEEYDLIKAQWE